MRLLDRDKLIEGLLNRIANITRLMEQAKTEADVRACQAAINMCEKLIDEIRGGVYDAREGKV